MSTTIPARTMTPAILGGTPVFANQLPMVRPTLPPIDKLMPAVKRMLQSGKLTNSASVQELEMQVAETLGVPECVAVSSCTSGLILTLKLLNLQGEVILPSFTFFASGHAVVWNGLTPVFADCEPDSFNLDPNSVEELITPETSAILAVHMYGNPASTQALEKIARRNGLKLIFDSAHAFGSKRDGIPVGGFGDAEVFSLSPTKLLVGGEGGLVTTRDSDLAARLRAARNYGDLGTYDPIVLGLNARMPEFNALLALHGLSGIQEQVERRRAVAKRLSGGLRDIPGVSFQVVRPSDICNHKDFSLIVAPDQFGLDRDTLGKALTAENVDVRKYFYPPMHQQKLYRKFYRPDQDLSTTETISSRVLSLPIYSSLENDDADRVIDAIHRIYRWREMVAEAVGVKPKVLRAGVGALAV